MAATQLSDLFVPSIFGPAAFEASTKANKLISSGAVALSPALSANLAGGGIAFTAPSFLSIADTAMPAFVPNDDPADIAVPKKVSTHNQVAIRLERNNAYSVADLAAELSGTDPMARITGEIGVAINTVRQGVLLKVLAGTVNETRAANLVNTIASESVGAQGAGTKFSASALISTMGAWGDTANAAGMTLAIHSDTYRSLQLANLIQYVPTAGQDIGFGTYLGMTLLVDDDMPKRAGTTDGTVYTSYLIRNGAIQLGVGSARVPVELERQGLAGNTGGVETVIFRDVFSYHVNGYAWAGSVAALPTDAALATASNWSKVFTDKQVGVAAIVHNI